MGLGRCFSFYQGKGGIFQVKQPLVFGFVFLRGKQTYAPAHPVGMFEDEFSYFLPRWDMLVRLRVIAIIENTLKLWHQWNSGKNPTYFEIHP